MQMAHRIASILKLLKVVIGRKTVDERRNVPQEVNSSPKIIEVKKDKKIHQFSSRPNPAPDLTATSKGSTIQPYRIM
jgi:hypothetical protein